jgi:hypothetical protein
VPVTGCSKIARRRPLYVPRLRALGCWPLAGPAACHATSSRPLLLLQAARPAAAQGLSTISTAVQYTLAAASHHWCHRAHPLVRQEIGSLLPVLAPAGTRYMYRL